MATSHKNKIQLIYYPQLLGGFKDKLSKTSKPGAAFHVSFQALEFPFSRKSTAWESLSCTSFRDFILLELRLKGNRSLFDPTFCNFYNSKNYSFLFLLWKGHLVLIESFWSLEGGTAWLTLCLYVYWQNAKSPFIPISPQHICVCLSSFSTSPVCR